MNNCPHFPKIVPYVFKYGHIKPNITNGWLCLKDGCVRYEKYQQFAFQAQKMESQHKIFINMSSLVIYCITCSRQILDHEYKEIFEIRQMAIEKDPEQQKILYLGQKEYPPTFHKEKQGICGLLGQQLNSYTASVIQLFAHVSPLYQIFQQLSLQSVHNQTLRTFAEIISKVRTGRYRILQIQQFQKLLVSSGSHFNFGEYSKKTPSSLVYEILKYLVDELQYSGPQCYEEMIEPLPLEEQPQPLKFRKAYSPMHSLFSGSFHWQGKCKICKNIKIIQNDFECIRLECENMKKADHIHLHDLIGYTFDLTQNSPFQNKKCQKCKEKVDLNIDESYMHLPNLLLLQFSSLDGIRVTLPSQLDLSKYSKDKGVDFIYSYVSSIGRVKKKYVTHLKQNQRQYIFDDVVIKDEGQKLSNVKVAVYKLSSLTKNKNISKNVSSSIQVNVNCHIPLPDFWHLYINQLRKVQPLVNPFICRHGLMKPSVNSKCSKVYKLPPEIYQYLVEEYGGYKILAKTEEDICETCEKRLQIITQIRQSERQMAKFADQMSSKKNKSCIQVDWLSKWKKYLYEESTLPYNSEGNRRPGLINNKKGLDEEGEVIEEKFKKVSPEVWYFFKKFYGGGPLIAKNVTQPNLAAVQAINLRYENIKDKIQFITKNQY